MSSESPPKLYSMDQAEGSEVKQTTGQYRVGSEFNPSGDDAVTRLKTKAAAFIDECATMKKAVANRMDPGDAKMGTPDYDRCVEQLELLDITMRQCEQAAMWAVKAATKPERK